MAAAAALAILLGVGRGGDTIQTSPTRGKAVGSSTISTTTEASGRSETVLKVQIKDPDLGHVVKVLRMVRKVEWPEGYPVSEKVFEIVAVEVEVTAGWRFSAPVQPRMLALSTTENTRISPSDDFGKLLGAPLPTVERGQTKKGWLYYKVDRGIGSAVTLELKRPRYRISNTGKTLPAAIFPASLSK